MWKYNSSGCITSLKCDAGIDSVTYSESALCKSNTKLKCSTSKHTGRSRFWHLLFSSKGANFAVQWRQRWLPDEMGADAGEHIHVQVTTFTASAEQATVWANCSNILISERQRALKSLFETNSERRLFQVATRPCRPFLLIKHLLSNEAQSNVVQLVFVNSQDSLRLRAAQRNKTRLIYRKCEDETQPSADPTSRTIEHVSADLPHDAPCCRDQ